MVMTLSFRIMKTFWNLMTVMVANIVNILNAPSLVGQMVNHLSAMVYLVWQETIRSATELYT